LGGGAWSVCRWGSFVESPWQEREAEGLTNGTSRYQDLDGCEDSAESPNSLRRLFTSRSV